MEKPVKDKGKERAKDDDSEISIESSSDEDIYNIRAKMDHIFTDIVAYSKMLKIEKYGARIKVKISGFDGYNGEWYIKIDHLRTLIDLMKTLFSHSGQGLEKIAYILPMKRYLSSVIFQNEKNFIFDTVVLSPYVSEWTVDTIQISFVQKNTLKLFNDATTGDAALSKINPKPGTLRKGKARQLFRMFENQHEKEDIENTFLQQALKDSAKEMEDNIINSVIDKEVEEMRRFYNFQLDKKAEYETEGDVNDWVVLSDENYKDDAPPPPE